MNQSRFDKPAAKDLNQLLSELHRHRGAAFALRTEPPKGADPEVALKNVKVTGIAYDSRKVEPGDIFVAIEGQKDDGTLFIEDAINRGATAVLSQKANGPYSVPLLIVSDVQAAFAILASAIYDYPSQKLRLLGVTGTNGKTTTTHLIEHILKVGGIKAGLIGTLGARLPLAETAGNGDTKPHTEAGSDGSSSHYIDLKHTTPQASDLQSLLATMVNRGVTHAAMEVSSHALALKRVHGSQFATACLTNISQDHLDFHLTMEHYWQSKRILFEMLAASGDLNTRTAVVNLDDELAPNFIKAVPADAANLKLITYSFDNTEADIHVIESQFDFGGTKLKLATPGGVIEFNTRLAGRFNIYNVMAAMAVCLAEGLSKETIAQALSDFTGVSGRFEVVSAASGQVMAPFCIVDYAHTPDGLKNVLNTARALVPVGGKLTVIFGCGGDRDTSKRPQMGAIAEDLADQLVITSDNPRSEDPEKIIQEILAGLKRMQRVTVNADRSKAILHAVMAASPQDVVVVAGKGHETYQILGDKTIHFDDREEVAKSLQQRTGALKSI